MIIHRICLSKADSTQKHSPTAKSCLLPKKWIVREIVKSYFTAGNQSFWEILGAKCEKGKKFGFCLAPGFTWCGFRSAAPAVSFFAAFSENRGTPCQGWSYLWAFGIEVEKRKRPRERGRGGKSVFGKKNFGFWILNPFLQMDFGASECGVTRVICSGSITIGV